MEHSWFYTNFVSIDHVVHLILVQQHIQLVFLAYERLFLRNLKNKIIYIQNCLGELFGKTFESPQLKFIGINVRGDPLLYFICQLICLIQRNPIIPIL